jgi:hypothetical protein
MFGTKLRQFLQNKISRTIVDNSLTAVCASSFLPSTVWHFCFSLHAGSVLYTELFCDMCSCVDFRKCKYLTRNEDPHVFEIYTLRNVNAKFHISLPCTKHPAKFSRCQFQAFAGAEICAKAAPPPVFGLISKYFCKFSFCYMIYAKTFLFQELGKLL